MIQMKWLLIAGLCVTLPAIPERAVAATPDENVSARLDAALDSFDQAVALSSPDSDEARRLYRQAAEGFESIIREGTLNGYLHYNAGNARMRLGDLGQAIAHYRRAERLLPGDENIRRNLAFARSRCEVQIPPTAAAAFTETVLFWHHDTSTRTRTAVALGAYAVFWGLLFAQLMRRRRSPWLRGLAWITGVFALATVLSVAWDTSRLDDHTEGVTIADNVVMRKGNGEGYQPQLDRPLPQGVEFRILEERPDANAGLWYRVRLRDGKEGWLQGSRTEII
jgi:tetratricopeptide (TPR) repeat protein